MKIFCNIDTTGTLVDARILKQETRKTRDYLEREIIINSTVETSFHKNLEDALNWAEYKLTGYREKK